jgi:hypothetical protein
MFNERARKVQVVVLLAIVALVLFAPASLAQDYRFNLKENRVDVYLEQDGTVYLVYDLTLCLNQALTPSTSSISACPMTATACPTSRHPSTASP